MGNSQRAAAAHVAVKESRSTDGDTRRQVMLLLLKDGPVTASHLGERLGLSAAGIRRHLDNLVEEELTEVVRRRPAPRRGRHAAAVGQPAGRSAQRADRGERLTHEGRAAALHLGGERV